ncbi:MAG: EAL domain-containing protein [Gammaproteobacteria bacterium]|nr:EAL domain-containing protein [Gammaproteobacteria bacterium]
MIEVSKSYLNSKVGRRLTLLFILSALIPLLITAAISYTHVSKLLLDSSQTQTRAVAKSYGTTILERLNYLDQITHDLAQKLQTDDLSNNANFEYLKKHFDTLVIYKNDASITLLGNEIIGLSFTAEESNHLKEGKPLITVLANENNFGSVYLSRLVDKNHYDKGFILGKIKPVYLWGPRDSLSYNYQYCVFFNHVISMYCADIMTQQTQNTISNSLREKTNPIVWQTDDNTYFGASWILYLKHQYMSSNLSIVAGQSKQDIFSPIRTFQLIFPLSILAAILIATFISLRHIFKILNPLDKLIAGTRQLADKQFNTPVDIKSNDEFEELADSFNDMSTALGKQFLALETLSKLDRLILSAPAPGHIIEIVIQYLSANIEKANVSISILKDSGTGDSILYMNAKHSLNSDSLKHFILSRESIVFLLSNKQGKLSHQGDDMFETLHPLIDANIKGFFVLPIVYKNKLYGSINVGLYGNNETLAAEDESQCLALSDRISVALASSDKEEQLYQQAHYDNLTGLPNRQLLKDRFSREIIHAKREEQNVAILFLDLDRFKNINDSLGHSAGDVLLQQAGKRLKNVLRDTDTIARIGGDEFTIILSNISNPSDAGVIAKNLIDAMAEPFIIHGQTNFIGASVGIAIYPTDGSDGDEILKKADTAMYRAKDMGRNTYAFFTQDMNTEAVERIELENALHTAIEKEEFILHYQPLIEIKTNTVIGCEVLIRWQRPGHEHMVSPEKFISIAEDTGQIDQIGSWVIQSACKQFGQWKKLNTTLERIAINVSAHQFSNETFVESVQHATQMANLSPHHVELEVTENLLIHDMENSIAILNRLHDLGFSLSIDDFGTGYSSLSYLRAFPAEVLKIDRSFIIDMPEDHDASAIVKMIIELAHSIGKKVIVEGIETVEQADIMRELGADICQGYYFSRPLSADNFLQFIQKYPTTTK